VYQILSESTGFCRRYDKNISECFFGSHAVYVLTLFILASVIFVLIYFLVLVLVLVLPTTK